MPKIKLNVDASFFNEAYLPLLNNKERFTVMYGGGGSGKSVFCTQKMILKALKSKRKILVVRKVLATIRESCFALFLEQLSKMGILQYCKYTTSHMKIELMNGSEIIFMGLEDSERLKSITNISDIYIEEATEISLDDFFQLNLRLRSNEENQQIHILFNPVSVQNWVHKFFFQQEQEDCIKLKTTWRDNKFLPQSYIDSLLSYKETNPLYYQIYAEGEFGSLDEAIFNNWKIEKVEDKGDLYIGCDFGYSQDSTAIVGCYIEGSNLYIVGEIYKKKMFIDDISMELKKKGWDKYSIACDSAEPRSIADLKRQGIKAYAVKKGKDSINHGISWLQNMTIIIDEKCENVIREIRDYTWLKDKDGTYIQKPNPACSDHTLDALRYATEIIRLKNNKVIFMDKSVFGL
jgi:phage terminase large subunit